MEASADVSSVDGLHGSARIDEGRGDLTTYGNVMVTKSCIYHFPEA